MCVYSVYRYSYSRLLISNISNKLAIAIIIHNVIYAYIDVCMLSMHIIGRYI